MRSLLSKLYLLVAAVFIVLLLARDSEAFWNAIRSASLPLMLAAAILNLCALIIQSQTWALIQRSIGRGKNLSHAQWTQLFMIGYLGRYVPGKISMIVGRVLSLAPYGYDKKCVIYAALAENISFLVAALFAGITVLLLANAPSVAMFHVSPWIALVLATLGFALLIAIAPLIERIAIKTLLKLRSDKESANVEELSQSITIKAATKIKIFTLSVISNLLFGLSFSFILQALSNSPLTFQQLAVAMGAFPLAVGAGVLALFAPSGIGVREGVITLLLFGIVGSQLALIAALVTRVMMCIIELITYLASSIAIKITNE